MLSIVMRRVMSPSQVGPRVCSVRTTTKHVLLNEIWMRKEQLRMHKDVCEMD